MKILEFEKRLTRNSLPTYVGKQLPLLEAVTAELEDSVIGLEDGDAIDPTIGRKRVEDLQRLQGSLIFVRQVMNALSLAEPLKFDLEEFADGLRTVLSRVQIYSDPEFTSHFEFTKIPGTNLEVQTTGVTESLWVLVLGDNPSRFIGEDLPVEQVSYDQITGRNGFLERLLALRADRNDPCKYRLPTAREWEYAARGGTTTINFFGDNDENLGEYAWFRANADSRTHPVGMKEPNHFGLYDMNGNVSEWTSSLSSDSRQVYSGGNWRYVAEGCRSAQTSWDVPSYKFDSLGFRLVRTCS